MAGCGWPDPFFDYLAVSLDYIHGYTSTLDNDVLSKIIVGKIGYVRSILGLAP